MQIHLEFLFATVTRVWITSKTLYRGGMAWKFILKRTNVDDHYDAYLLCRPGAVSHFTRVQFATGNYCVHFWDNITDFSHVFTLNTPYFLIPNIRSETAGRVDVMIEFNFNIQDLTMYPFQLDRYFEPDYLIISRGAGIPVHGGVLRQAEDLQWYMDYMCVGDKGGERIFTDDVVPTKVMKAFVNYLYTGSIPTHLDGLVLRELFEFADKWTVERLGRLCAGEMLFRTGGGPTARYYTYLIGGDRVQL